MSTQNRVSQASLTEEAVAASVASGIKMSDAKGIIGRFVSGMRTALINGKRVNLHGFISLGVRKMRKRIGRNPRTGEAVEIPAGRKVFLKTSGTFKEELCTKRAAPSKKKPTKAPAKKPTKAPAKDISPPKKRGRPRKVQ